MRKPYTVKRTDAEIKRFIDSRDVLTKGELMKYIYNSNCSNYKSTTLDRWWGYVLETKDWNKLKEYRNFKIKWQGNKKLSDRFNRFKEIYNKDERIKNCGSRICEKVLRNVYNMQLPRKTILLYKKIILCYQQNNF